MRLAKWSILGLTGVVSGALLGEFVAGNRLVGDFGSERSYSELSANPKALTVPDMTSPLPCHDCADSYGAAARPRAVRNTQGDEAYRELGAVEMDWPVPMPDDDYRYGGRFPDPQPPTGAAEAAPKPSRSLTPLDEAPTDDEPPRET